MPETARPSTVLTACRVRHEQKRQDKIDIALAISNLVLGGFSSQGTDTLDALAHLFTENELSDIREEREERQQIALQQAQLAQLRLKWSGKK